ncbi:hypothetical protein JOC93_002398 [Priestia taiwanensis]|uniref:DUF2624 domain-containing protein n=2 Tax=Priestia taiwanensis TaxID=1347902 RepID=A0A917ATW3_9BACI|nr:hypothetical protein [Priestia taiwanensis]GGE74282.1 hypothetical protein GCM10007140_25140 [Priestia taiwanensis]
MNLMKIIVNKKINNISVDELLKLCHEHQITVTYQQAQQAVQVIKQKKVDIYDDHDRLELINKIAYITNPTTAEQVNGLLLKLIKK